jgi:hypothetical protein
MVFLYVFTHRSSDGTLMTEVLQPFFEFEKDGSSFLISNPEHGAVNPGISF